MHRIQKAILIVIVPILLAVSWPILRSKFQPESDLPIYGQVQGTYKFIDQDGKEFSTDTLKGSVWLVNFFFTSCNGPCPIMTAQISGLLNSNPSIYVLSVSTDPDHDTSDVLKAYSAKMKTDSTHWTMAYGSMDNVKTFGQDILKLPVGETPDAHSSRIVLIDRKGLIRGWYDSQEAKIRDRINKDLRSL
jgi:protein SCO1/2